MTHGPEIRSDYFVVLWFDKLLVLCVPVCLFVCEFVVGVFVGIGMKDYIDAVNFGSKGISGLVLACASSHCTSKYVIANVLWYKRVGERAGQASGR